MSIKGALVLTQPTVKTFHAADFATARAQIVALLAINRSSCLENCSYNKDSGFSFGAMARGSFAFDANIDLLWFARRGRNYAINELLLCSVTSTGTLLTRFLSRRTGQNNPDAFPPRPQNCWFSRRVYFPYSERVPTSSWTSHRLLVCSTVFLCPPEG